MSTITADDLAVRGIRTSATGFDRALLRAAAALDAYVVSRVERRRPADRRRAIIAQAGAAAARQRAEALAAIGMLPR